MPLENFKLKRVNAHKEFKRTYKLASVRLIIAVLSIGLLIWAKIANERQLLNFALEDAVMDMQINAASAHLLLHETFISGDEEDFKRARLNIDNAVKLSGMLLNGGKLRYADLEPLEDPDLRAKAKEIADILSEFNSEFNAFTMQRLKSIDNAGGRFYIDGHLNHVYSDFMNKAKVLDGLIDERHNAEREKARHLFSMIIIAWMSGIVLTAATHWNHETRRRKAERELEEINNKLLSQAEELAMHRNNLSKLVEERTVELVTANSCLERLIKEKIALEAEAIRVAQLASLGELAAGVAHEINNPINGIINYARLLEYKGEKGSRENEIAGRILKEGRRIACIVSGLLSFAREGKKVRMPAHIRDILSDSLGLTEAQLKKEGITLKIAIPGDLPAIMANGQQIQQVFMNLISNGRHALNQRYPGPHEGKILEIIGEQTTTDEGQCVRITFRDRGAGISADILSKVMEPFFSTKPQGKGTGLGLSISRSIIADHGGKLSIESAEGEYTSVTIDLPAGR